MTGLLRLTAVTTTNPESFTLDGASNITSRTGPAATYPIDGSNRPTADGTSTLVWSAADRLTGRGADTFAYDPLDRLTASTVAGTTRGYAYSGDGLLQSRTTGGTAVTFLWDPATSPSRLLAAGPDLLVYGLGPLYAVNGAAVTTYARDGQKSIRAELAGSTVTSSFRYRAYGEVAQSSGAAAPSILGYAGQLRDPSGLLYMRARWYDPVTARFLSRDGLAGDSVQPTSLNAFAYAGANPIRALDPTGLAFIVDYSSGACDETCNQGDRGVGATDVVDALGYEVEGLASLRTRASALGRILRTSPEADARSAAARALPFAGRGTKPLATTVFRAVVRAVIPIGVAVDFASGLLGGEDVIEAGGRTVLRTAGALAGVAAGGAVCGVEAVATAGFGAVACPVIVITAGAGGSLVGSLAGDLVFGPEQ